MLKCLDETFSSVWAKWDGKYDITGANTVREGRANENPNADSTSVTWIAFCCVWSERFSAIPKYGANPYRVGGPIHRGAGAVTLHVGCSCTADYRWCAAAGQSFCSVGPGAAWTSDCEHSPVSHFLVADGSDIRDCRDDTVVHR